MVFGLIAGVLKGATQYFGRNNFATNSQRVGNVVGRNVPGTEHDNSSNDKKNIVMDMLRPYSKMSTPFDNVLKPNKNVVDYLTIIKTMHNEDSDLSVKLKYTNSRFYNTNRDLLTLRIDSKRKLADLFRPYVQLCDEQTVGLKLEPDNDYFSGDVGFCQKSSDNRTTNMLYTMAQFKHPVAVVNASCTLSQRHANQSPSWSRAIKMEVSNVFGYRFKHFGVFGGCRWMVNSPRRVRWRNSWCPEMKCGLTSSTAAGLLTVKPSEKVCVLDGYWKVNDKLEVATSLKSNWSHLKWVKRDYKLGMVYTHSDSISVDLKTDLNGNVSTGLSLTDKSFKLGLYYESNVRDFFDGKKFGFSLIF